MSAVVMMVLGGGLGVGVLLLAQALRPQPAPLREVFARLDAPGVPFDESAAQHESTMSVRDVVSRVGSSLLLVDDHQLRRDLDVTGSSIEEHAFRKALGPAVAVTGSYGLWLTMTLLGVPINPLWVTLAALSLAAVAFVLPDISLRRRAGEHRLAFRHALSAYLDLVTIILAGGGGLVTALQSAADAGDGWVFAEIRAALDRARLSNRTPWSQLGELGERFDVPELRDLVAAAELAGSEGARISQSIATKAEVLRSRLQAEVEQRSESLTEQMLLPVGLLLVALFLFLGFAVFHQFGTGAGQTFEVEDALPAGPLLALGQGLL